jgi:hypothetical protein
LSPIEGATIGVVGTTDVTTVSSVASVTVSAGFCR